MKNSIQSIIAVLIIIILVITVSVLIDIKKDAENLDCIRIHIRANSNSDFDQNLKLKIKDTVINYLTPLLAQTQTKGEAMQVIVANLKKLQEMVDRELEQNKVEYLSTTNILKEEFPAKKYGDYVLDKGVYDALIINLGTGKGDNWWCVAFPPLCFVPENGVNVRYKSKIMEIINNAKVNNQ